ncbi:MAG: GDSL-type esterase/lipase family protein, partial [Oscillospiraceae bacterium]|nr:GDSL-type esterase/lipase family protein [Oscillospiraceae bacterium]
MAAWAVVVVLAVLLIIGIVRLIGWIFTPKYVESANIGPLPPDEDAPIVITTPPVYYDYGSPVPEAQPVQDSYFDSVLMIGDARVAGFPLFGYLPGADYLVSEGISVDAIKEFSFDVGGASRTLSEQLAMKQYEAVYIQVGLNELGWPNTTAFVDSYAGLVDAILSLSPDTSVYMQAVIPITAGKSGNPGYFTNEKVAEYNRLIQQIAESKKVYFLNIAEGMSGGTGVLHSGYAASNGMNLTKEGYVKWIDYMRTHVV